MENWDLFEKELKDLINRHSIDNRLSVPDYLIAVQVVNHLSSMASMINQRDEWFGFEPFGHLKTELKP